MTRSLRRDHNETRAVLGDIVVGEDNSAHVIFLHLNLEKNLRLSDLDDGTDLDGQGGQVSKKNEIVQPIPRCSLANCRKLILTVIDGQRAVEIQAHGIQRLIENLPAVG